MAQWTRDAWDLRRWSAPGGIIGLVVGSVVFSYAGGLLKRGLFSTFLGLVLVAPIRLFLGVRIAPRLLSD